MLLFLLVGAISYTLGIILNKFVYTQKSSVNIKQVPVVLVFLITLIVPSLYYGLEVIVESGTILNQIMLLAFIAGFAMYSAVFKSKSLGKSTKEQSVETKNEEFITVTVKDTKQLGNSLLNSITKSALINYHKEKIPSKMQMLVADLSESESEDLAKRVLRELQDEYEKIDLKLAATNTALENSTDNDERQVLANVLQRFIEARSNLEDLASRMGVPIDIINGSRGVAHNSTKIKLRKDSVDI